MPLNNLNSLSTWHVRVCSYDPRWDPDYACVGGQEWNACGTPCIRTCHYRPDPEVMRLRARMHHWTTLNGRTDWLDRMLTEYHPNYILNALTCHEPWSHAKQTHLLAHHSFAALFSWMFRALPMSGGQTGVGSWVWLHHAGAVWPVLRQRAGETLEQIYNPVKPAMPYPYGWAGARKSWCMYIQSMQRNTGRSSRL